uniref:Family with sequence similarity 24, member A n=1 Tax=Jaculus jaculus TaxID=51337 RepID=A0A8C5NX83_JACJA|nr:protein FAM24A [Jaculus jaculus]
MFDPKTKIMIGIASSLLIAAIVLIVVVLSLYFKVSKALTATKEADVVASDCTHPCKTTQSKAVPAKVIPAEARRALQPCEECSVYIDAGTLPPCFCGTNEGL